MIRKARLAILEGYDLVPFALSIVRGFVRTKCSMARRWGKYSMLYGKVIIHIRGDAYIGERFMADGRMGTITLKVAHGATLYLDDGCVMGPGSHIEARHVLRIGKSFLCGPGSAVIDDDRHYVEPDRPLYRRPTVIGDNVWLGRNSIVRPGITIGDGTCVGANSVVTRDLPPNVFAAGSPATVIRKLELPDGWTRRPPFRKGIEKTTG